MQITFSRLSLLGIACMMLPASCASAQEGFLPDDGRDDQPALQAHIDDVARKGGGTIQLKKGTYDLSRPIYLRDRIVLQGAGDETVLSNKKFNKRWRWYGTVVFAGHMNPGSYEDNGGKGYPGVTVEPSGLHSIEVPGCDPAKVAGLPGKVVWLTAGELIRTGVGQMSSREYGIMNAVDSVDGCTIGLADPIGIPASLAMQLHWSDGSKRYPDRNGEPNSPIRDAGLADLQIESGEGQALLISCYRCSFTNLTMMKTRRLISLQGARGTVYRNIRGAFTERGIEVTKYASDSLIENVRGRYVGGFAGKPRPALRFAEFSRRNTIRDVTMDLGSSYKNVEKIRFDASAENSLSNITLIADALETKKLVTFTNTAGTSRDNLPAVLENVRQCSGSQPANCIQAVP